MRNNFKVIIKKKIKNETKLFIQTGYRIFLSFVTYDLLI